MSWMDYVLPKKPEGRGENSEAPEVSSASTDKKHEKTRGAGPKNGDTSEDYVSKFIDAVSDSQAKNIVFGDGDSFDAEAEKIKSLYIGNPVKVIMEPEDESFLASRKKSEVKPVEQEPTVEHLSKEERLALLRTPNFMESYKIRENKIDVMARENCCEIELEFKKCLSCNDIVKRMTLCYEEDSRLKKCLSTQKEVLKSIRYAFPNNTKEMDDRLADVAYDVILEEEKHKN